LSSQGKPSRLAEEMRRLAKITDALGIVVSELRLREQIARNEITSLNSELEQAWLTEQHLCSLNDHLCAQINELCANADQQPKMPHASGWEGLDLASKIFILAMKIQAINWEENREERNRNITVDGGLLV
jgi:hypothetical protein